MNPLTFSSNPLSNVPGKNDSFEGGYVSTKRSKIVNHLGEVHAVRNPKFLDGTEKNTDTVAERILTNMNSPKKKKTHEKRSTNGSNSKRKVRFSLTSPKKTSEEENKKPAFSPVGTQTRIPSSRPSPKKNSPGSTPFKLLYSKSRSQTPENDEEAKKGTTSSDKTLLTTYRFTMAEAKKTNATPLEDVNMSSSSPSPTFEQNVANFALTTPTFDFQPAPYATIASTHLRKPISARQTNTTPLVDVDMSSSSPSPTFEQVVADFELTTPTFDNLAAPYVTIASINRIKPISARQLFPTAASSGNSGPSFLQTIDSPPNTLRYYANPEFNVLTTPTFTERSPENLARENSPTPTMAPPSSPTKMIGTGSNRPNNSRLIKPKASRPNPNNTNPRTFNSPNTRSAKPSSSISSSSLTTATRTDLESAFKKLELAGSSTSAFLESSSNS